MQQQFTRIEQMPAGLVTVVASSPPRLPRREAWPNSTQEQFEAKVRRVEKSRTVSRLLRKAQRGQVAGSLFVTAAGIVLDAYAPEANVEITPDARVFKIEVAR